MSSRKYVICVTSLLYVFIILNFTLWHCITRQAFAQKDLNRLGTLISTESLTQNVKYSKHHTEFKDYISSGMKESFDVITIGDSFSNGGGYTYYQDYLEDKYGIKCLNVRFVYNCLDDLYILINSGMLDKINPKVVILESVERSVQGSLGINKIDSESISGQKANNFMHRKNEQKKLRALSSGIFSSLTVQANMDLIYNKLYHIVNNERLSPEVYITELNRNVFTNPGYEHTLLHYYFDLNYMTAPVNAETVNMNLNNAARILREKGIMLIFMPCADKYDLYYPYVINHNGRPENNFFPEMRRVSPKEYVFIDTMKILRDALERGEQDIYWFGDTHWSWKGAELVCDELVKYFDWLN
ncbi:MAG: hypothetical protein IJG34_01025 [Synergistaceae bacterium]|nr:hypothetical protein [Synergistaceae bacterium]MBQ3448470.1 hypothetical protein [Synergistaceae bacterium]MBQ3693496.1 hypothetical protein [Synergistaceae bacterium]MBQ9629208.1 hypothetical protein [Synergistaceae bacterium]MBR0069921.1 hypothetical protein [Synergistaceae bacterium]